MKIQEFLKLSYGEASTLLRTTIKDRFKTYGFNYDEIKKKLGTILDDLDWEDEGSHYNLEKNSKKNALITVEDRYYVTRIKVILKLRYNDDISINYHIGNTPDSVTLREISFSGVGNYWEGDFTELSGTGLDPHVTVKIPRVSYKNGRKGTVVDHLSKNYNMLKLKMDFAISEMIQYIQSGKFTETWGQVKDSEDPEVRKFSSMSTTLGNYFTSLIADPSNMNLHDMVLFLKMKTGRFGKYQTQNLNKYFSCVEECNDPNFTGFSQEQVEELKVLSEKTSKNKVMDDELNGLSGAIKANYDTLIEASSKVTGISIDKLKRMLRIELTKKINYQDIQ